MARKKRRSRARTMKKVTLIPAAQPDPALSAIRVLSEGETAKVIGVSTDTLRRMAQRGEAPPRLELSTRRIGYRVRDIAAWLDARAGAQQVREGDGTRVKRRCQYSSRRF
jgi:predicted DNA-binding transcriptional regulator AlpA